MFIAAFGTRSVHRERVLPILDTIVPELVNMGATFISGGAMVRKCDAGGELVSMDYEFQKRVCEINPKQMVVVRPKIPYSNSGGTYKILVPTQEQMLIAEKIILDNNIVPHYSRMSSDIKGLFCRNLYQLTNLKINVDFGIYAGHTDGKKVLGGTGCTVELAKLLHVPTFNLLKPIEVFALMDKIESYKDTKL